jgi:hypothetical protein
MTHERHDTLLFIDKKIKNNDEIEQDVMNMPEKQQGFARATIAPC